MRIGRRILGGVAALALLAASSLGALALCEVAVRLVRPQMPYRYPQGLYVPDARLAYRLAPGFEGAFSTSEFESVVRINAQGHRADRVHGPKEPGVPRVLFVGDSFTMGLNVEADETFVALTESLLRRRGVPIEVVNAGVPGYNTRQELIVLERDGRALDPDVVVLVFFVGNDVEDNARPIDRVVVRDGYLAERDPPAGVLPYWLRQPLARRSHLYHLLWPIQRALFDRRSGAERAAAERRALALYARAEDPALREGWAATRALLREFAGVRGPAGRPRLAVVVVPDAAQVDGTTPPAPAVRQAGDAYALDAPSARVVALCRDLGLPALDLLPVLASAPDPRALYLPLDRHLTAAGNRLAAEAIARFLADAELVPAAGAVPAGQPGVRAATLAEPARADR